MTAQQTSAGPAAPFITGCIYSPPGLGKTAASLAAFPTAICMGSRESIVAIGRSVLGIEPTVWPWYWDGSQYINMAETLGQGLPQRVDNLEQQLQVMAALASSGWGKSFGAVYADDQSLLDRAWLADKQKMARLAEAHQNLAYSPHAVRNRDTNRIVADTRSIYGDLNHLKTELSVASLNGEYHFWSSAHEVEAWTNPKDPADKNPTGPDFGSKKQVNRVPAWYSACYRMRRDNDSFDPWLSRCIYFDKDNLDRVMTKDRPSVCWTNTPANIRAILTASAVPYALKRYPGTEHLDEVMERVSEVVVQSGADRGAVGEVITQVFKQLTGVAHVPLECATPQELHARWGCQDGIALGIIRLKRGQRSALDGWAGASAAAAPSLPPPPAG